MDIDLYIANVKKEVEGVQKEWIDDLLSRLPKNATIFEIGSATARDALYMEKAKPRKVSVICSDIENGFITDLEKSGRKAINFNILKDSFANDIKYDAIYSHNLIARFRVEEVKLFFKKVYTAVKDAGYISFSFAQGDNSTLTEWNGKKGNVFCRFHSVSEIMEIASSFKLNTVYENKSSDGKTYFVTFQK
jgi:cyclopropane fatty-acyl-phospholipid synthase-like methyltransferase